MWTVDETATRDVVTVTPETTADDCGTILLERGLRHLPVVDEGGRPVALVSDDRVLGLIRRDLASVPALSVGDSPEILIDENAGLKETIEKLLGSRQTAALIVDDDGVLTGIFTEHDVLRLAETALSLDHKVGEIAHKAVELVTIPLGTPAYVARAAMFENHVRHLLVVTDKGRLAGVVSQRDLAGFTETILNSHMNAVVQTVGPDDDLHKAISTMVRHSVGSIPVVQDDHTPVGVITRSDIMRALVEALD